MACLHAGLLGIVFLGLAWPSDNPLIMTGWTLVTAYALFCWSSVFHETAHHTLNGPKEENIKLGRVLGTLLLVPYTAYRETHIRHHAYMNTPDDWELWPYSDPQCSRTFRRCFVWFDLLLGMFAAPFIYGRIFFSAKSPLKTPGIRRTIRNEYLVMIVAWGTIFAALTVNDAWPLYVRAMLIPSLIAGFVQTGRKLTEHLGMPSYDPLLGTRTVVGKNWLTRLGSFVNFEIFVHGIHHRHPRLHHDSLREKMEEYVENNREIAYPVFASYWQATRAMLPYLFKNPGVGMNAGAAAPVRNVTVQDFVADTAAIIAADERIKLAATAAPVSRRSVKKLQVVESRELTRTEKALLGDQLLENFEHCARFSTEKSTLFFAKVYDGEALLGVAPVIRIFKHKSTDVLQPKCKWWLVPLIGGFAKQTSYMVESAFTAFGYRSPFWCVDQADRDYVKLAVSNHLKAKPDVDTVWISEPPEEAAWATAEGYDPFQILPMAHVNVEGCSTFDEWMMKLDKVRRQGIRKQRKLFDRCGAKIEILQSPFSPEDAEAMYGCLHASSHKGWLCVPYGDVVDSAEAFRTQKQVAVVARLDGKIVGFASYVPNGDTLYQCHGGLDYERSQEINAYYNVLSASIEFAIERGFSRVSFGPLNNETKRRVATDLMPLVANLWSKVPFFRIFTRLFVMPNMQVFQARVDPANLGPGKRLDPAPKAEEKVLRGPKWLKKPQRKNIDEGERGASAP